MRALSHGRRAILAKPGLRLGGILPPAVERRNIGSGPYPVKRNTPLPAPAASPSAARKARPGPEAGSLFGGTDGALLLELRSFRGGGFGFGGDRGQFAVA